MVEGLKLKFAVLPILSLVTPPGGRTSVVQEGVIPIYSFLDDFLILGKTYQLTIIHTEQTIQLLTSLGFTINREKSSLTPLQELEFLGVWLVLQSLHLSISSDKVLKVLSWQKEFLKEALLPWGKVEMLQDSIPMNIPVPSVELMTDASLHGWSGVFLPTEVRGGGILLKLLTP